ATHAREMDHSHWILRKPAKSPVWRIRLRHAEIAKSSYDRAGLRVWLGVRRRIPTHVRRRRRKSRAKDLDAGFRARFCAVSGADLTGCRCSLCSFSWARGPAIYEAV